jgi:hypothetical protein
LQRFFESPLRPLALTVAGICSAGCRERPPAEKPKPAPVVVTAPAAPSAPSSGRPVHEKPAPEPGQSPLWSTCFDKFEPQAAAHVDVVRLGMLCGPANGLTLLARASGVVDEARGPFAYQWEAERGDCFRVFAVAEAPVDDLEVEVFGPPRERLFLENQNRRWVLARENGPFCAPREGTFEAQFTTHGGHGTVAISIWRGARMLAVRGARTKL